MTELDVITPEPKIDSDPDAVPLWDETGKFIRTAQAQMEHGPLPSRASPSELPSASQTNIDC
jgi:hypothetical protein